MSFELLLRPEPGRELADEAVDAFFASRPYVSERWRYAHPDTGVTFTLQRDGAGLRLEINVARPRFFAREAMPVVAALCEALELHLVDPQDVRIGGDGLPKAARAEELIDSWAAANRAAVELIVEHRGPVLTVPRPKADAWWRYQLHRAGLEERFRPNVFVPQLLMLQDMDSDVVQTAVGWTDAIPTVLPPCDWLIVDREWEGQTVAACADASTARRALRDLLSKAVTDAGTLEVLTPGRRDEAVPIYRQLPTPVTLDRFQAIASDEYVDEPVAGDGRR